MFEDLTQRQVEVLAAIEKFLQKRRVPPSQREIGKALRITGVRAVQKHLQALQAKGYLKLHAGRDYGIELLRTPDSGLPLIGQVAAGLPIEAVENVERYVNVPPDIFRRRPDYLLRVRGDSMIEAGIRDGDWIAIRKADTADSGEIVVAMRDGEVTVKELLIEEGFVVLKPHNRALAPIRIPGDEVMVVGVYTGGLIRPT
jgi:repressor LexA